MAVEISIFIAFIRCYSLQFYLTFKENTYVLKR